MSDRHRYGTQHRRSGGRAPTGSTGSSSSQQYVLPATTYVPAPANASSGGGHDSVGSQYASSSGDSSRGRLYDQYGRDHRSTPSRRGSQQSEDIGPRHSASDNANLQRTSMSTVMTNASRVVPVGSQQFNHPHHSSQRVYISPSSLFDLSIPGTASHHSSSGAGSGSHHTPGAGSGSHHTTAGAGSRPASAGMGSRPASAGMGSRRPSMDSQRQRAAMASVANTASQSVQIGTNADPELTTFGEGTRSHELMLRLRRDEEARAAAAAAPPRPNPVRTFFQRSREAIDRRLHQRRK